MSPGTGRQGDFLQQLVSKTDTSLKYIGRTFFEVVNDPADRFKARCALLCMIQDAVLRMLEHRIVAYYLLSYGYSWAALHNVPFLKFFVQVCRRFRDRSSFLQCFASQCGPPAE